MYVLYYLSFLLLKSVGITTFVEFFKEYFLLANEQAYQHIERMDVAGVDVDRHFGLFHLLFHTCAR